MSGKKCYSRNRKVTRYFKVNSGMLKIIQWKMIGEMEVIFVKYILKKFVKLIFVYCQGCVGEIQLKAIEG